LKGEFDFVFLDKLREFNEKIGAESQLTASDFDLLQTLLEAKNITETHIAAMNKVLVWPKGNPVLHWM
jgi:hypothetical protein